MNGEKEIDSSPVREAREERVAKLMFALGMMETKEQAREAIEDASLSDYQFHGLEWFVLSSARIALERKNQGI